MAVNFPLVITAFGSLRDTSMRRSSLTRKRTGATAGFSDDTPSTFKPPKRLTPKVSGMDLCALGHDDEVDATVSELRTPVPSPIVTVSHNQRSLTPQSAPKRTIAKRLTVGNFKAPSRLSQPPAPPPSPPSPRPQTPAVPSILRQASVTAGVIEASPLQGAGERDGLISPFVPEPPLRRKKSVTVAPAASPRLTRSVSRSKLSKASTDDFITPQKPKETAKDVLAPESVLPPSPPRVRRPNVTHSASAQGTELMETPVLVEASSFVPPDSDDDVDYYGTSQSSGCVWVSASPAVYPSNHSQYHLLASMSVTPSRGNMISTLGSPTASDQVVLSASGTLIGSASVSSCLSARTQTPFGSSVARSQAVETGEFGDYGQLPSCGDYVTNPNLNTSLVTPLPAAIESRVNGAEVLDRGGSMMSPPPNVGPLLRPTVPSSPMPSPIQTPASVPATSPRIALTIQSVLPHLPEIVAAYHRRSIHSLYDWQSDCLSYSDVLSGRNLLYSAPTSGGKTLVAEVTMHTHNLWFSQFP